MSTPPMRWGADPEGGLIVRRWYRPLAFGLATSLLLVAAELAVLRFAAFEDAGALAIDYRTFVVFGQRWLDTGTMYLPSQLAGPFDPRPPHIPAIVPSMYPPLAAPAFAALTLLPAVLWWAIPLSVIAWCARRAAPWTWPLLGLAACWPATVSSIMVGSTTMWVAAGSALAVTRGWPALVALVKPSLVPLLILGIHRRSFWIGLGGLAIVSLAMLDDWARYLTVVRNVDTTPLYSLQDLPFLAAAVVASVRDWPSLTLGAAGVRRVFGRGRPEYGGPGGSPPAPPVAAGLSERRAVSVLMATFDKGRPDKR